MHHLASFLSAVLISTLTLHAAADPVPEIEAEGAEECPDAVRGVELSLKEMPRGVVLQFVVPANTQRSELERMLRAASALVEYQSKLAALQPGQVLSLDGTPVPPVDIEVKATKHGARVTVSTEQSKDVDMLVVHARSLKELWDHNACIQGKDGGQPLLQTSS